MLNLVFENVFVPERLLGLAFADAWARVISRSTLRSYRRHRLDLNQLPCSDDLIHSGQPLTHLLQEAFILLFLKPACLSLPVACLFVLLHPCRSTRLWWPRPQPPSPGDLISLLISDTCQSQLRECFQQFFFLLDGCSCLSLDYSTITAHICIIEIIQLHRTRVHRTVLGFSHAIVRKLPNSGQTGLQINKTAQTA